jgi:hypothetical protein
MNFFKLTTFLGLLLLDSSTFAQTKIEQRKLYPKRITTSLKIDGVLDEAAWKDAAVADKFTMLRPAPFIAESEENATKIFFLYNNEGLYIGGILKEKVKDSIASELIGRDGFGNNDFLGVVFDTYNDKLNGFEYFVTPLGEQMDAKVAPNNNGNNEDFSWNAVWQSASKINNDGWSFEMFLPYSAIRFGKKKIQDWGLNIVRKRQKSGQQSFWQSIDPNTNGFLTQEGMMLGLEDIKPPLRLQFSPYFSTYYEKPETANNWKTRFSGGVDVKYGINQAFTLDMTLIPDFGQVVTDNAVLNLGPFDVQFEENRPFFTEGTELFGKGNLFYSRRIGVEPNYRKYPSGSVNDEIIEDPNQAKIVNATKISGRTQKGLGIGVLNAITQRQYTTFLNKSTNAIHKEESMALTNYNVFVLNQSLKNNSSLSLVNTSVLRDGKDYDANVTAALFDLNNKKNTYNVGGSVTISNLIGIEKKPITGYAHNIYFGKTSGRFNFNVWQELSNKTFDKSDIGYFTNNNTMDQGFWMGYNWNKPRKWYNSLRINTNWWYSRLVTPIDVYNGKENMFQGAGGNFNFNAQTKKLWSIGFNVNGGFNYTDFYEARIAGRIFKNKGRIGMYSYWNSNDSKKLSWGGNLFTGTGGIFKRVGVDIGLYGKIRFNSKFSIDHNISTENSSNQPGFAGILKINPSRNYYIPADTVIFSRRDVRVVENIFNVKYSFTNKMGLTLRVRHYWSKVNPKQFYELDKLGNLNTPTTPFIRNVKQNYNFLSADLVYTWQFAQGSFINLVWKDVASSFNREFEKNYFKNFNKTIDGPQSNSLSLRVIYFIDYVTAKNKLKRKSKV